MSVRNVLSSRALIARVRPGGRPAVVPNRPTGPKPVLATVPAVCGSHHLVCLWWWQRCSCTCCTAPVQRDWIMKCTVTHNAADSRTPWCVTGGLCVVPVCHWLWVNRCTSFALARRWRGPSPVCPALAPSMERCSFHWLPRQQAWLCLWMCLGSCYLTRFRWVRSTAPCRTRAPSLASCPPLHASHWYFTVVCAALHH